MSTLYRPAEAARRLGVSRSTLRRFADLFTEFLPDYSRRNKGDRRQFTDGDLRTLRAILDLQDFSEYESREDLLEAVRDGRVQLVVPATLPRPPERQEARQDIVPAPDDDEAAPLVPRQDQDLVDAFLRLVGVVDRQEQLQTEIDQLKDAREKDSETIQRLVEAEDRRRVQPVRWLLYGVLAAVLGMFVMLGLVMLLSGQ